MAEKVNRLRKILQENRPSVATRLWDSNPFKIECIGATGNYDYIEYLAEYSPTNPIDFENMARAAELHDMAMIVKLDLQNRGYVAQKAIGAGAQGLLFADVHNAQEVRETLRYIRPDTEEDGGCFGFPNRRYIGFDPWVSQTEQIRRQREVVAMIMIEKKSAMDEIEEICSIPGVDMVQFGPSDYCMSQGLNLAEHKEEARAAERVMIETALRHGVQPRCEIHSVDDAAYYRDLGVRHFCLGDEMKILRSSWNTEGGKMRAFADQL